jgi:hypothetical protein
MGADCRMGNVSSKVIIRSGSRYSNTYPLDRQFYDFIFLSRSWAADRTNLTLAFTHLGQRAKSGGGMWLLIFPEGTITSDEERAKSVRYAEKEGVVSGDRRCFDGLFRA